MEITNFQQVLLFRAEKASAGKFLPIYIYIHIVLIRVLNTKYSWGGEGRVKERERKRKKKESIRNERKNMRGGREPSIGPMTGAFACDQVESRGSRFRVPPPRF